MNANMHDKHQPKVLLVEDCAEDARFLQGLLEECGCLVTWVTSAKAGLEESSNVTFDFVISDLAILELSNAQSGPSPTHGVQFVQQFRQQHPDVDLLVMSNFAGHAELVLFDIPRVRILSKCLRTEVLLQEIQQAVQGRQIARLPNITAERSGGDLPMDQLADEVLINTTAAFIHKLNGEFNELSRHANTMEDLLSPIMGKQKTDLLAWRNQLARKSESIRYLLERFRNTVGRHPGSLRATNLSKILCEVQAHCSGLLAGRVVLELSQRPCVVMGDYELLWHLFENLVRNALEAVQGQKDAQVTVRTSVEAQQEVVRIVVRDNGKGIAPEDLPRIFDPDFSTKPKGLGIGLFLVRKAAHIHGGEIECRSELGKGTTFTVSLRLMVTPQHSES